MDGRYPNRLHLAYRPILFKLSNSFIGFYEDDSFRVFTESEVQQNSDLRLVLELTEAFRSVMFSETSFNCATSDSSVNSTLQLVSDRSASDKFTAPVSPIRRPESRLINV